MTPSENNFRQGVLDILLQSEVKMTPQVFVKKIQSCFKLTAREAKKIVQGLVASQELCYHQTWGATYIEQSFLKPVRVTRHFVLSPPGFHTTDDDHSHTIVIEPGISFGSGQHPTTRMCLEAIDRCFFSQRLLDPSTHLEGVDVGCGSGVLALAMVKSGLALCQGFEIDPVSVHEARKNVRANDLGSRIQVIDDYMPAGARNLDIICANLRYPTLQGLASLFARRLKKDGILILSGIREWETTDLIHRYETMGFSHIWQDDEKKWSGVMLRYGTGL